MLRDVVEVRPLGAYRVYIRFEDELEAELDLGQQIRFEGVFRELRDPLRFAEVRVHRELGTIFWPNGADLDPDVLYSLASGKKIALDEPPDR